MTKETRNRNETNTATMVQLNSTPKSEEQIVTNNLMKVFTILSMGYYAEDLQQEKGC
jgi:hypothetical protein